MRGQDDTTILTLYLRYSVEGQGIEPQVPKRLVYSELSVHRSRLPC